MHVRWKLWEKCGGLQAEMPHYRQILVQARPKNTLNTRTKEQIDDTWNWKVILNARKTFGAGWYGSGGYVCTNDFSEHFGNLCRDCSNRN